ncbi:MAG: O-antigen ligase family protein [bacterium]
MVTTIIGRSIEERAFAALLATAFTITFSIALGQMCATVCLLLLLTGLLKRQITWRWPSVMGLAATFITVAIILSAIHGEGHGLWARVGRLFWFILIPVTATLASAPGRDRKVIGAFLGGCAVLGVKDLVWYPILAWRKPLPDYLTSLIDKGSMTDGQMLMLGVVGTVLILMMAIKEGRRVPWYGWMILMAQISGLVINFKRGSWFCAIILVGVAVLMHLRWRAWVLALALLVGFFAFPPVQARMGELKREFNVEGGGRLTMWFKIAPSLISEHPAGVGFGCLTNDMMRQAFKRVEPNRNHLHANWAQILVETGWLGLGLYLVWMGKTLKDGCVWVRRRGGAKGEDQVTAWVALALLVGLLLNGFVEYNFGDTELMFIYALLMGLFGLRARHVPDHNEATPHQGA